MKKENEKWVRPNFPLPKFKIGESVFVMTKDGMELQTIRVCFIRIMEDSHEIYYWLKHSYEDYKEAQLFSGTKEAKQKLLENSNQLQLLLS